MPQVISLLIAILVFAIVAYGLFWVCTKFGLPQPILWICGVLLIIVILLWVSGQLPGTSSPLTLGR